MGYFFTVYRYNTRNYSTYLFLLLVGLIILHLFTLRSAKLCTNIQFNNKVKAFCLKYNFLLSTNNFYFYFRRSLSIFYYIYSNYCGIGILQKKTRHRLLVEDDKFTKDFIKHFWKRNRFLGKWERSMHFVNKKNGLVATPCRSFFYAST